MIPSSLEANSIMSSKSVPNSFDLLNLRSIKAKTICIHGDQNNAVDFAKNISIELSKIDHYEKRF